MRILKKDLSLGSIATAETDNGCYKCFLRTYGRLSEKFPLKPENREEFIAYLEQLTGENHLSSPEIQRLLYQRYCSLSGEPDLFREEKKLSNRLAFSLYQKWRKIILAERRPIETALRLAIAGNIMDYGAGSAFDLQETIERVISKDPAIDHSKILIKKIGKARKILYIGDNAGEIYFDRLLIEVLMHNNLSYAVRSGPILNDATLSDACEAGMDEVADVITTGWDGPSVLLHLSDASFLNAFRSADVVISKGQGNYEGLSGIKHPGLFFLMMVKCDKIADDVNAPQLSYVVKQQGV